MQFLRPLVYPTCFRVLHKAKLAAILSSQLRQTRFLQTKKSALPDAFLSLYQKIQLSQQAKHILARLVRAQVAIPPPASLPNLLTSFARAKLALILSSQLRQTRFQQTKKKRPLGRFFITSINQELSQQAKHILARLVRAQVAISPPASSSNLLTSFARAKLASIPSSQPRQTRFLQAKKSALPDAFLSFYQRYNYLSKLSTFCEL